MLENQHSTEESPLSSLPPPSPSPEKILKSALETTSRALLDPFRVVLVGTQYAGNVGAIARLATNFALRDVRLAFPRCAWKEGEALLYAREHSRGVLEGFAETQTLPDALEGTHFSVGFSRRMGDLRNPNITLDDAWRLSELGRVALVFGCEESGLSNEQILQCTHICSLPTADLMPSLNLSHAVAVVLSRLFQLSHEASEGIAGHAHFEPSVQADRKTLSKTREHHLGPVTHDNFETLVAHWRSVMVEAGLNQQGNPDRMLADIRRMLQRATLTERDANILHGVLQAVERSLARTP